MRLPWSGKPRRSLVVQRWSLRSGPRWVIRVWPVRPSRPGAGPVRRAVIELACCTCAFDQPAPPLMPTITTGDLPPARQRTISPGWPAPTATPANADPRSHHRGRQTFHRPGPPRTDARPRRCFRGGRPAARASPARPNHWRRRFGGPVGSEAHTPRSARTQRRHPPRLAEQLGQQMHVKVMSLAGGLQPRSHSEQYYGFVFNL